MTNMRGSRARLAKRTNTKTIEDDGESAEANKAPIPPSAIPRISTQIDPASASPHLLLFKA